MRIYKLFHSIFFFGLSCLLVACSSNPVGDFGRIDIAKADQLTKVSATSDRHNKKNIAYFNPINYSKLEKKFRLIAHYLQQSNFDVFVFDREMDMDRLDINGPVNEKAIFNSFNFKGLDDIPQRFQSIARDIDKRSTNLTKFQDLIAEIMQQNADRGQINNEIINADYIKAISLRHEENIELIKNVRGHMKGLYLAYRYVLNHGKIVEPDIDQNDLRSKLQLFNDQINQLAGY